MLALALWLEVFLRADRSAYLNILTEVREGWTAAVEEGSYRRHVKAMAFVIVPCKDKEATALFEKAKQKGTFPTDARFFRDRPNMDPPASYEFVGIIAVYAGTSPPVLYPVGVPKR